MRAVTEAAQSRLSLIHGGRDNLLSQKTDGARRSAEKDAFVQRHLAKAASERHGALRFDELPDHAASVGDIPSALALLLDRLAANGLPWALRVALSPPELPIQVVRVIVPAASCAHGFSASARASTAT